MGGGLAAGIGSELSSTVLTGSLLAAIPIALLAGLVSFASRASCRSFPAT
jgi:cytochrome c-type biogenesis protein